MQCRETLAEAVAAKDFAALQGLEQATRAAAQGMLAEIGELLDVRHDYPAAAEAVRKYRFLEKFLADIDAANEEIGY